MQGTQATEPSPSQPLSEQNATTLVNAGPGQINCHYCKETGHKVDDCLKLAAKLTHEHAAADAIETTGAQLLTAGLGDDSFDDQPGGSQDWLFLQQHGINKSADYHNMENKKSDGGIPTSWILLDNQSTINVFMNHCLLKNIHTTHAMMKIHCNAGISCTNQVSDLPGYCTPQWYCQ